MKKYAAAVVLLFVFLSAHAQEAATQDSQAIRISRSGSQSTITGPSSYFTGSVSIDPLFGATEPSRSS